LGGFGRMPFLQPVHHLLHSKEPPAMRRPLPFLLALFLSAPLAARAADDGFEKIFNGKDLSGWDGDPKLWSVKDEAITGITDGKIPNNSFIIWKGTVANFELKLKFKLVGGNSGVQYRSKRVGKPESYIIAGYQADIDSAGKRKQETTGILYEERGRGYLCNRGTKTWIDVDGMRHEQRFAESEELVKTLHAVDWNDYHIIAKGNHLTHMINDKLFAETIDFQKDKAAAEGLLAFQIHANLGDMVIQFKDILLKKLPEGGELTPEQMPIPKDAKVVAAPKPKKK
jgi:Domain of Unknown Function (DUF1080)